MANTTVYPFGPGQMPSGIGVIDDLTTGGITNALSAEQGVVLKGIIDDYATLENTNPDYPDMIAVAGDDYTVLENKSASWNADSLTDTQGNYCVIIKMRARVLSFINRKSGYGAVWIYSAEPSSSDYTQNRTTKKAITATSGTLIDNNMMYVLMDIGTNINTFRCWFTNEEPTPNNVVTKIDNHPIKVSATYIADENLFSYENQVAGGSTGVAIFEFSITAGLNYFVMWNDANTITPVSANDSWIEYDSEDNALVTSNFYQQMGTQSIYNFGTSPSRYGKKKLNTSTTKLRIRVSLNENTMESLAGKVRMYVNSDGHLTRFLYPLTLDGRPIIQPALKDKVIACFGDSITSFGSGGADGGYPFFLQKKLDNGIANYGRGNATFADWSDTDYTTYTTTENNSHNNTISSQIRWMLADGIVPDIAIFNGGINDIGKANGYSWDIDAAVAAYPTTTASVFQNVAMVICYAISVLRNLNPNVKIYIATTCKTLTADRTTPVTNFAQKLRDTAEAFGLEVIDFYRYAQQPHPSAYADNAYYNDETHPSQLGVDLMGRVVMGHLKNYVAP